MPARNSRKQYLENGYYHIYNRGVEKRNIFLDSQDYSVFLSYLKEYLLPKEEEILRERLSEDISWNEKNKILKILRMNNFNGEIILLSYCLMPNHFHLFIKQKNANSIDTFMNSLCTRYTMYFNKKYKRVGSLYQGVYKGVLLENEEHFLHLSRYIHRQSLHLQVPQGEALKNLREKYPCSYYDYIGKRKTEWVHPEEIVSYFSKTNPFLSYETFVLESENETNTLHPTLLIEESED